MEPDRIGDRIRTLFSSTPGRATVIAPFIKVNALRSLLSILPTSTYVRCVTRWLPQDIAQGVSDLEVLDIIEERGNSTLTLVDNLHAKIYIADDTCLVGSSNVTSTGFGDTQHGNLEVLVETNVDDPGVATTLDEIEQRERVATRELADRLRMAVEHSLASHIALSPLSDWIPFSFKPERAYSLYSQNDSRALVDMLIEADRIVLQDVFNANIMPGKSESEFSEHIREKLAQIPEAGSLLRDSVDKSITSEDLYDHFSQYDVEGFSERDLWRAFVNWMTYFFPDDLMKQEITEIALRRAHRII